MSPQPCGSSMSGVIKSVTSGVLSAEDIAHYQGIVAALSETIEVMDAIDVAIPGFPIQ